jgi:hypothetical protein
MGERTASTITALGILESGIPEGVIPLTGLSDQVWALTQ